ncbi:helix-turn-helix domain-containing protein [Clostridioides difficile]|uniref:helix-turn-helix domain-containing protein n=1 Tax=Clostridioides difficile TaxID=1496 RepID=UPI001035490B|nr:helix-turn-helix transcriptional regulator [Clostridioides difficile]MDM9944050.1 helix-turn-helix transcriptional regulator [Clostridioides difficile]
MKLEKLKEYRIKKRYTHQIISEYLNMASSTYSRKEKGIKDFKIEEFENISKVLGLSDDEGLELLGLDYLK